MAGEFGIMFMVRTRMGKPVARIAAWLLLFIPLTVGAGGLHVRDGHETAFPYGLYEIRGYPMEMNKDGRFRIYSGSTTFVEGTFQIKGREMIFYDRGGRYACRGKRLNPGRYYWAVHDRSLYLMLIKDRCGARSSAFLEAPLKMKSGSSAP